MLGKWLHEWAPPFNFSRVAQLLILVNVGLKAVKWANLSLSLFWSSKAPFSAVNYMQSSLSSSIYSPSTLAFSHPYRPTHTSLQCWLEQTLGSVSFSPRQPRKTGYFSSLGWTSIYLCGITLSGGNQQNPTAQSTPWWSMVHIATLCS